MIVILVRSHRPQSPFLNYLDVQIPLLQIFFVSFRPSNRSPLYALCMRACEGDAFRFFENLSLCALFFPVLLFQVGPLFVDKVLTTPGQEYKLLAARSRDTEGKTYYTFEFAAKTPTYVRHGLASVSIRNNRFYCLVTGANERRWQKVKDRLTVVADSFINII